MFRTDGCTLFPDGWWTACCLLHDYLYWWQPLDITRSEADTAMLDCMKALGANSAAAIASVGLGAFGWIFWMRGRRGTPGAEPPMLTRWAKRITERRKETT